MDRAKIEAFAKEAAKSIKTTEDLTEFSQMLKKIIIEAALNAEMDEHLGYEKYQKKHDKHLFNITCPLITLIGLNEELMRSRRGRLC